MNRHSAATLLAPAAAALVVLVAAAPASARQDAGDWTSRSAASTSANASAGLAATEANSDDTTNCPLQRVGTQLVRCDNLTGNGVSGAASVPLRSAAAAVVTSAAPQDEIDSWTRFIRHGV